MRFISLVFAIISVTTTAFDAFAADINLKDDYGVYWVTPKNPAYGPGAVLQGYLTSDGKQIYVKQAICWPKLQPVESLIKDCKAIQPGIVSQSEQTANIDITLALNALLNVGGSSNYLNKATLRIENPCLVEMSVQEQIASLEDKACLAAVQAVRRKMSKLPLRTRLLQPGKYLLVWQTTRALYGDAAYELEFKAGATANAKTAATEAIKNIGGSLSIGGSTSNKVNLKGSQIFLGLLPRYYEEWFLAAAEQDELHSRIEALASNDAVASAIVLTSVQLRNTVAPEPEDIPEESDNTDAAGSDAIRDAVPENIPDDESISDNNDDTEMIVGRRAELPRGDDSGVMATVDAIESAAEVVDQKIEAQLSN